MTFKVIGASSLTEVDSDASKQYFVAFRPDGATGHYSKGLASGVAGIGNSASVINMWMMRWTSTARFACIHRIDIDMWGNSGAGVSTHPSLVTLFKSTSFTVSPTTNINQSASLNNYVGDRRSTSGRSHINGGMWITGDASGGGLSGHTAVLETDPFAQILIALNTGGTFPTMTRPNPYPIWDCSGLAGQHPIVLQQNEGLVLQLGADAGPSGGSLLLSVNCHWSEVVSY